MPGANSKLTESLNQTAQKLIQDFNKISNERKAILEQLSRYIEKKIQTGEAAKLTFICTHNSRRSHISQIWAQAAAAYYGIGNIECYSGGTETTAFNPRAVKALEQAGFKIQKTSDTDNPVYEVFFSDDAHPVKAFSKVYYDNFNPQQNFAAVMTCSHADQNCPMVIGADARISIPYNDPKDFDGTAQEASKYQERVEQIGCEMLYAFSIIKTK